MTFFELGMMPFSVQGVTHNPVSQTENIDLKSIFDTQHAIQETANETDKWTSNRRILLTIGRSKLTNEDDKLCMSLPANTIKA